MKKWFALAVLSLFIISILSITNITYAEELAPPEMPSLEKIADSAQNTNNITGNLQASTNEFLSRDITIPAQLEIFSKILFGVNESSTIDLSTFIVLAAIWVVFLLIIKSLLEIIPLFGDGWKSWLGAAIITALSSITGSLKDAALFFFGLGNFFKNQGILKLIFTIIPLIIIGYGAIKLLHMLKHNAKKAKREQEGFEEGAGI